MQSNDLSNVLNCVNEKDAIAFKSSLVQALNNRLFAALETRKSEVATEILGESEASQENVNEANVLAPTAPPTVGVKKKVGKTIVPPPQTKAEAIAPAKPAIDPNAKAKADMLKAKSAAEANKAKIAAVDIKKNVLDKSELTTMQKQIDAVMDNSVDIGSLKPVPGGFEVKKAPDDGLNPTLDREFLMKTFQHNGKIVELKQIGLGLSRPIRVYIDGTRWNFFPGLESAAKMAKEYINMTGGLNRESVEAPAEPISEKVDLDGRTRLVRDTMSRIENYRKSRMEKMKKMQEEEETGKKKYDGLYVDGTGKGAFVPEPYDTGAPVHPYFKKSVSEGIIDEFKKMFKKENMNFVEGDKEEYQRFFKAAMKRFGISAPSDLKGDAEKKKFFDYIKKNYKG
jgi:hypothetical protein